jgi:hypothetical protein
MKDKFIAYLQVQEMGAYNMFDPRARVLAQEFCEEEISLKDWVAMMREYSSLYDKYVKE